MRIRFTAVTVLMLSLLAGPVLAEDLPTADDLKQLAADKKWPELLQAASRLLALKGDKAGGVDRVAVWSLKAEAQLQSAQFVPSADSFEKSAAEPKATPEQVDWGIAMAALSHKSDKRGYKPEATRDDPNPKLYDVLKESERKDAIGALFDVQASSLTKRFEKLRAVLPVKPTVEFVKDVNQAQHMERAGLGNSVRTDKMQREVATAFADAASKWSEASMTRLGEISATANQIVQERDQTTDKPGNNKNNTGRDRVRLHKRGLTSADSKELKDFMAAAERLADSYKQIEAALPEPAREPMLASKPGIQRVYDEAKSVLSADYRIETIRN